MMFFFLVREIRGRSLIGELETFVQQVCGWKNSRNHVPGRGGFSKYGKINVVAVIDGLQHLLCKSSSRQDSYPK
jgi:hypothetical protein